MGGFSLVCRAPEQQHRRRSEDVQAAREAHSAVETEIAEQEPTADGRPGRSAEGVGGIQAAHEGGAASPTGAYDAARQQRQR